MKIYIFLIISLLVSSCQLDVADDKSLEKIPIFDIQIPSNFSENTEKPISFKYGFTNGCFSLYEVETIFLNENTLVTTVFAKIDYSKVCTQEYSEQTHTFKFTPTIAQTYYLKFWIGQNAHGVDQYEEFELVINNNK